MHLERSSTGQEKEKSNESPTKFDEAVSLTGIGYFHYMLMGVSGLCLLSFIYQLFSTSFLLPSAQCDFQLTSGDKGLLNSMCGIGIIFGSHLWGFVADTRGRRRVLIITLFLDSLCTLLASLAHAFWLFLILRFFNGFFIVGPGCVLYAYMGEFHGPQTRSKTTLWVGVSIGIGIAVQPGIAWLLIPQTWSIELPWCTFNSWRLFVISCAFPGFLSGIFLTFWFPESPKFLMVLGKKDEALQVLRTIYARNTGNSPQRFPVKSLTLDEEDQPTRSHSHPNCLILELMDDMWRQTMLLFLPPFLPKTLLLCAIQYGLYASANGLSLWLPDMFNHVALYNFLHPDDHGTVCQSYAVADATNEISFFPSMVSFTSNSTSNNTSTTYNELKRTVFQHWNDSLESPNDNQAISDDTNSSIVFDSFNTSMSNLTYANASTECNADVNFAAFQNTLILGIGTSLSYIAAGYIVGPLSKKTVLVASLFTAGVAGATLNHVYEMWKIATLAGIFVTVSGIGISIVVTSVVDVFPTHLRAMAVCISLMVGRLGSVSMNLLLGNLLEKECEIAIFILGGISIGCALLCFLLPSPKNGVSQ